jgi:prepilin-type N-terminal cleavage/methylation domain-containing protein/prepilin-type processing-associated H-X9-DG protein
MTRRSGFSLVELLVVLAMIAMLVAMLLPMLSRSRDEARNVLCRSRIHQLGTFAIAEANDLDGRMPFDPVNYGQRLPWLWDLPKNIRNQFVGQGFVQENFYCPFNQWQNDPTLWEFSWYTVGGYYILWDMTGNQPALPLRTGAGLSNGYVWELAAVQNPAATEIVVDATISANLNFNEVWGGWARPHHTSHLSHDLEPIGGNIMYADGHADWRPFDRMDIQSPSPQQWF